MCILLGSMGSFLLFHQDWIFHLVIPPFNLGSWHDLQGDSALDSALLGDGEATKEGRVVVDVTQLCVDTK